MSKISKLLEEFDEAEQLGVLNDVSMEIKKDEQDNIDITCFKIPIDYKKKPKNIVVLFE